MSLPRPALHHTPPSGWVNDPLALTFHDGRYHLFFQYVPDSTVWALDCHWGHAISDDLLTWRTEPVALEPGDGEDGVWSGSLARPAEGEAVIFYTAIDAADRELGRVRRAVPADASWTAWRKEDVVIRLPEGEDAIAFRDPFVQPYGDGWRMLVGGGLRTGQGAVWASTSDDLRTWTRPRPAAADAEVATLWECPVLLRVDGRTVLVVSAGDIGKPDAVTYAFCADHGDRLELGPWQRLTYGPSLYAASGFTDADGDPGVIAWLRDVGDAEAGWMGAHSLPYRLRVSGERLVAEPPSTLARRRAGEVTGGLLPAVADLEWAAQPGDVVVAADQFRLDAVGETVAVTVGNARHELPWAGEPPRVVVDGPVLELFGARGVLAVRLPATGRDGVLTGDTERVVVHRLA